MLPDLNNECMNIGDIVDAVFRINHPEPCNGIRFTHAGEDRHDVTPMAEMLMDEAPPRSSRDSVLARRRNTSAVPGEDQMAKSRLFRGVMPVSGGNTMSTFYAGPTPGSARIKREIFQIVDRFVPVCGMTSLSLKHSASCRLTASGKEA